MNIKKKLQGRVYTQRQKERKETDHHKIKIDPQRSMLKFHRIPRYFKYQNSDGN